MSLHGANYLSELPAERAFDPRTGPVITRRWRGPIGPATTFREQLENEGRRVRFTPDDKNAYAIVAADYGAEDTQPPDEPLSDEWTLVGNDLEKSLWTLPGVLRLLDAFVSIEERNFFKADTEAFVRGERQISDLLDANGEPTALTYDYLTGLITTAASPEGGGNENAAELIVIFDTLIASLLMGVEAYTESQYVLRQVKVVSKSSTIKPSNDNVNRIFKDTEFLKSKEGIPELPFDLPTGKWLKRTPTKELISFDKYRLTQEYWHADEWAPIYLTAV